MKKILLAAALLLSTAPARAGITDDFWVREVGISILADVMCHVRNDELQARLLAKASLSTGASVNTVFQAGKVYALEISEYLEARHGKGKFCRSIFRDW